MLHEVAILVRPLLIIVTLISLPFSIVAVGTYTVIASHSTFDCNAKACEHT